jgi:hypothetical protein
MSKQRVLARKLNTNAQRRPHFRVLTRKAAPYAPMTDEQPYTLRCLMDWAANPLRGHFVAYGKKDTPRCFKLPARRPLQRVQELRGKSLAANGRNFYGDRRPRRVMAALIRRLGGGGGGAGNGSSNSNGNLPSRVGSSARSSASSGGAGSVGAGSRNRSSARVAAATRIQAGARGMRNRRWIAKRKAAATRVQAGARGMRNRRWIAKRKAAATRVQARARGMRNRRAVGARLDRRNYLARENRMPNNLTVIRAPRETTSKARCDAFLTSQAEKGVAERNLAVEFRANDIKFRDSDTIYSWVHFAPRAFKPTVRRGSPLYQLKQVNNAELTAFVDSLLCVMGKWRSEKCVEVRGFAQNVNLTRKGLIVVTNSLRLRLNTDNYHKNGWRMDRFIKENKAFVGVMGVLAQGLPWTLTDSMEPLYISAGVDGAVYKVGDDRVLKVLLNHWSTHDLVPVYEKAFAVGVGPRPYRQRRMRRGAVDLLWHMRSFLPRRTRGQPPSPDDYMPVTTFMMDHAGTMTLKEYMHMIGCPLPSLAVQNIRETRKSTSNVMRQCYRNGNDKAIHVLDMVQKVVKTMHQAGIVHGDLHSSNMIVQVDNPQNPHNPGYARKVVVIDFDRAVDINNRSTVPASLAANYKRAYNAMLQNQSLESPNHRRLRNTEVEAIGYAHAMIGRKFGQRHAWHQPLEFLANMLKPARGGSSGGAGGGGRGGRGGGAGGVNLNAVGRGPRTPLNYGSSSSNNNST